MIRGRVVVSLVVLGLVAGCAEETPDGTAASAGADAVTEGGPPSPSVAVAVGSQEPADVQSAWWSWAAGSPSGRNPVEDDTGEFCAVDQPSDLWFLAGTFGGSVTRSCDIPAGRTLVAPVVNQRGPEEVCADFMETATGTLTLDGKEVALKRWSTMLITITGVPDNPASDEGSVRAYGCGLWAVLPPLTPGPHKVAIRGSSGDPHLGELQPDRDSLTASARSPTDASRTPARPATRNAPGLARPSGSTASTPTTA